MPENPRIEELRRRVQADPASIAFAALAEEFRRVGRYEEAVETCRTGLQRHPAYLSARVTLGRALIETGDFEGAREELNTVLRSAPENLAAIRGLAQIHERIGHSAEMDPQLADLMSSHVESIRVAALTLPEPPPAPDPEPPIALTPRAAPEPELSMAPRPEPTAEPAISPTMGADASADVSTDPFAAFAPMSNPTPAPEYSLDLGAMAYVEPELKPFPSPVPEPEPEQQAPVLEMAESVEPGPDPEILATLARLERFLGAIESLRA